MKTKVEIIRKFNDCEIRQRNTDGFFFCASDLVVAGNK